VVLPDNPRAAFDLLVEVIEIDEPIVNQSGDADPQPTLERACDLLLTAARFLDPSEIDPILERLTQTDNYGFRRQLKRV
jgi:uncharacterized heparinase superfamily protein